MKVIPAIDLQAGDAVRLLKGDYQQKTVYSTSPWEVAQRFEQAGAHDVHIVDLDGAKGGNPRNVTVIERIKATTKLAIEVGGGIRSLATIDFYLTELGVERVILGTVALEDPALLKAALAKYGADRIVVGVDIKNGMVATAGWLAQSTTPYLSFLQQLAALGIKFVIVTDISKDGTLTGPNYALYEEIAEQTNLQLTISGGIKDQTDLVQLAERDFYAAIVGKAYYEGRIDLDEVFTNGFN